MNTNGKPATGLPRSPFTFTDINEFDGTRAEYKKALAKAQAKFHKSPEGIAFAAEYAAHNAAFRAALPAKTEAQIAWEAQEDAKEESRIARCIAAGRPVYYTN